MKKAVISIIITSIFLLADQRAITDNKVEVILKDDSTWVAVDSITEQIVPFAVSEDSQYFFLRNNGRWTNLDNEKIIEKAPKPTNNPIPKYPDLAKQAGVQGRTVVKMLVSIDGEVIAVQILKSSGFAILDEAAKAAAIQSKFEPAKRRFEGNWYEVPVWVSRPYAFKLQ
ncbi:MAG: energy transducer TonB [bacterium]